MTNHACSVRSILVERLQFCEHPRTLVQSVLTRSTVVCPRTLSS
jgi:hypothetical protein